MGDNFNFDNYGMKVKATVGLPTVKDLDAQIRQLEKNISKLKVSGQFDDTALRNLTNQLNSLKATVATANFSPTALNDLTNQVNKALGNINIGNINVGNVGSQASQVGQQIGQQISNGVSQGLGNSASILNSFRQSLQNIGMGSAEIDAVANRINNLGVQIESLNQSASTSTTRRGTRNILSVDISGVDKYGQAIKLTQQYDMANANLIRSVDAVSTAQQKAGTSTNTFAKQQSQAVANLTNQINQLNRAANDQNASRPISDTGHLNNLSTAYNNIISAIQQMGNASNDTFIAEQNNVKSLISDFKSLVSEFRNMENVSLKMKGTDLTSGIAIAKNDLEKFKADAKDFPQITQTIQNLDTAISNVGDASSLNIFNDQLRIARAELAKIKSETTATNRSEKVGINVSGLESKIADLQRISPEIDKFETEINGAKVSVQSLLSDLGDIKTQGDFSVINAKFKAFTDSAKSAGIAISETSTKVDTLREKADKIQLSISDGGKTDVQIAKLKDNFEKLGLSSDSVKSKMSGVNTELNNLKTAIASGDNNAIVNQFDKLNQVLTQTQGQYQKLASESSKFATEQQRLSLANTIEAWNQKNTAATRQVRDENDRYIQSLRNLDQQISKVDFAKIQTGFKNAENSMRGMNRLGLALKDQWLQATRSFTTWLSASTAVMKVVSEIRQSFTEMKEIDTYLTEISKVSPELSKSQLTDIGMNSYDVASKYGKKATNYLSAMQAASRAGYANADAMAEVSLAVQGAGDVTEDVANKVVIATDKAWKLNGAVEDLTRVFDGYNMICNRNALAMQDLSDGMSIVGSTASSMGVATDETAAAIGTMVAVTQQSGSEVARAFRAILLNIRQVSDEEEGIDAEGLTKYEKACNALNVKLKETKDGVLQLRDPMEVLKELASEYSKLGESDIKRTNLLNSVGGKLRSTQLDALLRNWNMYEKMLNDYAEGEGSMAVEAEKTAKSWEGSMNRMSNSFTKFIDSLTNQDALIGLVNGFASILDGITKLTDKIGVLSTLGAGLGAGFALKNIGKCM